MTKPIFKYFLLLLLLATSFVSCQKVIQVNLKEADEKYIVEALITDSFDYNYVKLSKTSSFYNSNFDNTGVEDAIIIVTDLSNNQAYTFYEFSKGTYKHPSIQVAPNKSYALLIVVGNDTITATSSVPSTKVLIDSIYVQKSEFSFFSEMYEAVPAYTDPVGIGNYYLLKSYLNRQNNTPFYFTSDEFIDGQVNKSALSFRVKNYDDVDDIYDFKKGDTLTVELYNTTKPVYTFFSTLRQNSSAVVGNPANPTSNVNGKAIGVFIAATVSHATIIANY